MAVENSSERQACGKRVRLARPTIILAVQFSKNVTEGRVRVAITLVVNVVFPGQCRKAKG